MGRAKGEWPCADPKVLPLFAWAPSPLTYRKPNSAKAELWEILLARRARASRKRDRKTPLLRLGAVLPLLAFDFILEKFLRGCRGTFFVNRLRFGPPTSSPYVVPYAVPPRKRAAPWVRGGSG